MSGVLTASQEAAVPQTERVQTPSFGTVTVYPPLAAPEEVVLFLSGDGGWNLGVVDMAERLRDAGALVVGIDIRAIRYFGSQPWPFPHSLMIGFTAEHAGGEIRLEESEIAEARWFSVDDLPQVPPKVSIARRLIDAFVARNQEAAGAVRSWL